MSVGALGDVAEPAAIAHAAIELGACIDQCRPLPDQIFKAGQQRSVALRRTLIPPCYSMERITAKMRDLRIRARSSTFADISETLNVSSPSPAQAVST